MTKFKPGDKVVCIDDTRGFFLLPPKELKNGNVYTVVKCYESGVYLEGIAKGFMPERFKKFEQPVKYSRLEDYL